MYSVRHLALILLLACALPLTGQAQSGFSSGPSFEPGSNFDSPFDRNERSNYRSNDRFEESSTFTRRNGSYGENHDDGPGNAPPCPPGSRNPSGTQPCGIPGGNSPDPVPVDGGLSLLLLAGAGYGAHRMRKEREEEEDEE